MDPFRELGRTLLVLGALLVFIGALLYFGGKLPFRLGRLPGDIVHRGEHTTFYFPIVTCLLLSAALSLLFWLFGQFRK
jgi:hypothetical protein